MGQKKAAKMAGPATKMPVPQKNNPMKLLKICTHKKNYQFLTK
jgi:hypothetical protein